MCIRDRYNSPSEVSTFENTRGQTSNIDVTFGSRSLERRISNWFVHGEVSISDHKLITFNVDMREGQICYRGSSIGFTHSQVKDLDWRLLDASVLTDLGELRSYDEMSLSEGVDALTKILQRAVADSAHRTRARRKLAAWWCRDLDGAKMQKTSTERRWKRKRRLLGADHPDTCLLYTSRCV